MKPTRTLNPSALWRGLSPTLLTVAVLALGLPAAQAAQAADPQQPRLSQHPAVLVARKGVKPDPAANFYLHPARMEWRLQRPLSDGEHPAVLVAHRGPGAAIDPNRFIVAPPARGDLLNAMPVN